MDAELKGIEDRFEPMNGLHPAEEVGAVAHWAELGSNGLAPQTAHKQQVRSYWNPEPTY